MILGMTYFDFFMPLAFLPVAAVGLLWLRHEGRKLDRELARKRDNPAE